MGWVSKIERTALVSLLACIGCGVSSGPVTQQTQSDSRFSLAGKLTGIGYASSSAVGPAPGGMQRLYLSYIYDPSEGLEIVGVDEMGKVSTFSSPASSESAGYGTIVGSDGNMYFGTAPHAHILRLDTNSDRLEDVGVATSSEQYVWGLTNGSDGKIYGCTYPSAKLIRLDPSTSHLEDLGRMDALEQYARTCAADRNGFVYVGIGSMTSNIAAYQISTGQHREIIPSAFLTVGFGQLVTDSSGHVHGRVGAKWFSLNGWTATPESSAPIQQPSNIFSDGTEISILGGTVELIHPSTGKVVTLPYTYKGKGLSVTRIGLGPDSALYASSALPFYLFRQNATGFYNIGQFGDGEAYSFLPVNGRLLIGAYAAIAPLLSYDVSRGFTAEPNPNPIAITYPKEDEAWRPLSMIQGEDDCVYIASTPGYGVPTSPLTRWDPRTNIVSTIDVLPDQSTASVASVNGQLIVGTSVYGGMGTKPATRQSMLVLLNSTGTPAYEAAPVANALRIANLIALSGNRVVGIADKTPFAFEIDHRRLVAGTDLPEVPLDNSLILGPDDALWGLISSGIFRLDPSTLHITEFVQAPKTITSGMAMDAEDIYFGSNSEVYRFAWR
jgi:streptogramin lyase